MIPVSKKEQAVQPAKITAGRTLVKSLKHTASRCSEGTRNSTYILFQNINAYDASSFNSYIYRKHILSVYEWAVRTCLPVRVTLVVRKKFKHPTLGPSMAPGELGDGTPPPPTGGAPRWLGWWYLFFVI